MNSNDGFTDIVLHGNIDHVKETIKQYHLPIALAALLTGISSDDDFPPKNFGNQEKSRDIARRFFASLSSFATFPIMPFVCVCFHFSSTNYLRLHASSDGILLANQEKGKS